jgi:ABC-type multidrug transport system ATPase subunit
MKQEIFDPAEGSAATDSNRSGGRGKIVAVGLTKDFGGARAVDDLSFTVERGSVTGFLGPNGAGKTTTLRMILGLTRPTSGNGTVSGGPYVRLANPGKTVGALLEATSFHPGRTARNHLRIFCAAAGLPDFTLSQSGRYEAGSVVKRCWIAGLDRMDEGPSGLSVALC